MNYIVNYQHIFDMMVNHDIVKYGHFKLTSGLHSDKYINKDDVLAFPKLYTTIIKSMVDIAEDSFEYQYVTGPSIAGSIFAAMFAIKTNSPFAYPEKISSISTGQVMKFRRGFEYKITGKHVLIIEDIITTGGSVQKTINAVEECGAIVSGIISLWNRTGWTPDAKSIICKSLINIPVDSYTEEMCPLCKSGIVLTDPKNNG